MNNKPVRKIIIVGGGSAAWLIASRLASRFKLNTDHLQITVVESPQISTIGVGEGTWPTMRSTLKKIGLSESDFIRTCNASFKQGTCFRQWRNGRSDDQYYHPFELPKWHDTQYLSDDWRHYSEEIAQTFDSAVSIQPSVCDQQLAPKNINNTEYQGVLNYAYHLDAAAFASLLRTRAIELGVRHIVDHIDSVHIDEQGAISHLMGKTGEIKGDFYFDCTGFAGLLVHQTLGVDYIDLQKQLFVDSALAIQTPYSNNNEPIASATLSTAHAAGWIWDIGLQSRRGVGCVYSSDHMTQEAAFDELKRYVGEDTDISQARSLQFKARHLKHFWRKNAVAVGLSGGFVEPLEASALVLIELTADWFCERFPADTAAMEPLAKRYNQVFTQHWQSIVDFLKLHYVLSERKEAFWLDNREKNSISDTLQERLALWDVAGPSTADPDSQSQIFAWQSYLYIVNAMRSNTGRSHPKRSEHDNKAVQLHLETIEKMAAKASKVLPTNRSLLDRLQNNDMAKI